MSKRERHERRIKTERKVYALAISVYSVIMLSALSAWGYIWIYDLPQQEAATTVQAEQPTPAPAEIKVYRMLGEETVKPQEEVRTGIMLKQRESDQEEQSINERNINSSMQSGLEQSIEELMKLTEGE